MRIRHALAIAALLLAARAGAAEPHPVTDREPAHTTHDRATAWLLTADRLEWQDREDGGATLWDVSGWYGGDVNRLWLRSEGERVDARTEHAEVQLLGGRAIAPWWTLLAGIRHDAKPGSAQTWGALGLTGTPLYGLEFEATAFVGENGRTAARIEGEYDLLLTHRLVLQPRAELNLHGRTDRERGIGAGLTSVEFGLRLRYEFRREFAPYLGVAWSRSYGDTADLARARGQAVEDARLVAGVRVWF